MDFKSLTDDQKKEFAEMMFSPLESSEDIKDWARSFLDLELPLEITDPGSTSSPLDAIWQIYNAAKNNTGDVTPNFILMSCREGMKTVSVAILELLIMLHFSRTVAHAAATEEQSAVAIGYIGDFITKIAPLLEVSKWENMTQNKRTIKYKTPEGKTPFIKILICTTKGMNSLHANFLFLDELDLADPAAIKQGKNIAGFSRGFYGIRVYLSTRKYAFGNMQEAIDKAEETNSTILSWNILDVTESCPTTRHKPELPKRDMFVARNLPLVQISGDDFNGLPDIEKPKYDMIPNVHGGCVGCKLLPVCKTRLSQKPQTATGGFYKPITSVIQKFADNDVDVAESELLCWKVGSAGLVYPRYIDKTKDGNVISIKQAYETLIGNTAPSTTDINSIYSI